MSKLTLPILCAYLPHKVKMYHPKTAKFFKSKGLDYHPTVLRGITSEVLIWVGSDNNSKHITEDGYKLLLRPLSSLTKPITHNGETFVPILRLAAIAGTCGDNDWHIKDGLDIAYHNTIEGCTFSISYDGSFIFKMSDKWQHFGVVSQQMRIYQLLHELHVDLYGLLESGDALPIEEDGK